MKRLVLGIFVFLSLFAVSSKADINSNKKVRLVYFVPSDRDSRESQITALRELLEEAHLFFADEMERHGYGRKTFNFEYDELGEPIVHEVHGKFEERYYNHGQDGTPEELIWRELVPYFDDLHHIFFVAMDSNANVLGDGSGGLGGVSFSTENRHVFGYVPTDPKGGFALRHRDITDGEQSIGGLAIIPAFDIGSHQMGVTLHELGHVFGLEHDFRESGRTDYIVGRGNPSRLSKCSAEWLSVHSFFNPDQANDSTAGKVALVEADLLAEDLIMLRFNVGDVDGLYQAQLLVPDILAGTGWGPYRLFDCQQLQGSTSVVQSVVRKGEIVDRITLQIIDMEGGITWATFSIQPDLLTFIGNVLDVDGNGVVDLSDLSFISGNYGRSGKHESDINGDAIVNITDVLLVASSISSLPTRLVRTFVSEEVVRWLDEAKGINLENEAYRSGFTVLVQLLDKIELLSGAVVPTGYNPRIISGHTDFVWSVAFSPDSQLLASGSWDRTVRLWSTSTGGLVDLFIGHEDVVMATAFGFDGRILASGSWDGTIRLWDIGTGGQIKILTDHHSAVSSIAFSPTGGMFAAGTTRNEVVLWNTATWQVEKVLKGHSNVVDSVLFSPDGAILASSSRDATVRLWDLQAGRLLHVLGGHTSNVTRTAFSPNGSVLASGSSDRTVRLWDVHAGELKEVLIKQTDGHNSVVFTPDGSTLVIGTGGIRLWDLKEREYKKVVDRNLPDSFSIVLSPDGSLFASGNADYTIHLWDSDFILPSSGRKEDVNGDGEINVLDLIMISSDMGKKGGNLKTDVTGDGIVNIQDLTLVASMFDK